MESTSPVGPIYALDGVAPTIAPDVFIAPNAAVIGDVVIGAESGVWFGCLVRGDMNIIRIGARTNLQDGTIVFANKAFAEMVGRDAGEVTVLKFHDIFHGALETESVLSVVDGLANMVVELAHQDGSTVHALMSRSALRRSDDEIALATFQDLTEHLWVNERG